ncbi:hypothetical protein HDU79_008529 [Rhizoclosmatium sp. JEL0117]|nr:hypothetical protein HDU79_008529 [Rhizoclosmatium sp. JEL0117]
MAAYCLPLTGSTMCPDYAKAGLSALIPVQLTTIIKDVATFDGYIQSSTPAGPDFTALMRNPQAYNCTGYDGTNGFRYYITAFCTQFVGQGITDPTTPCNPKGTILPICSKSMSQFVTQFSKVFATKQCQAGQNIVAQSFVNSITDLRTANLFSTDASCTVALPSETQNCGFATAAEQVVYCTSDVTKDPCCVGVAIPKQTTNVAATTAAGPAPTQAVITTPAAAQDSGSALTGVTLYVLIGGVSVVVILLAILLALYFCYGKPKKGAQFDGYSMNEKQGLGRGGNAAPARGGYDAGRGGNQGGRGGPAPSGRGNYGNDSVGRSGSQGGRGGSAGGRGNGRGGRGGRK